MTLDYSVVFAVIFVLIWAIYRFVMNGDKIEIKRLGNLLAIAFLGPIFLSAIEMISYGVQGKFLTVDSISAIQDPIGIGGLALIGFALYFLYNELTGQIKEEKTP